MDYGIYERQISTPAEVCFSYILAPDDVQSFKFSKFYPTSYIIHIILKYAHWYSCFQIAMMLYFFYFQTDVVWQIQLIPIISAVHHGMVRTTWIAWTISLTGWTIPPTRALLVDTNYIRPSGVDYTHIRIGTKPETLYLLIRKTPLISCHIAMQLSQLCFRGPLTSNCKFSTRTPIRLKHSLSIKVNNPFQSNTSWTFTLMC